MVHHPKFIEIARFEVLGDDIAKNVLRTLPRGNVMAPERFDQRHAAAAAAEAEGLLVGPPALENMCFLRGKKGEFTMIFHGILMGFYGDQ